MLSYQDQHLEQFYDPQGSYYQTMEVEQQNTSAQQPNNLQQTDGKVILHSTPDYSCYIESPPPQHHQNQSFNQAQYNYNNCNQNNLVLTSSAPSSNDSEHRTIGQVETADQSSGYDYSQVQHHHYINHEHQQHIEQCRTQPNNRITHLEPMSNSIEPTATTTATTTTTNSLNTPISGNQQKQRQQETHKQNNHQHNHLVASTTNDRQDSSTLVANHETDSSRSPYGTRIPNEAQVDDMYTNNNCNNVNYQDQHLEQFYEPQDSYYQTMEAEHPANLHYSGNLHTHNKLMIQTTGEYPCYVESNHKTPHHQSHQFNQSHYSYNNCDHNQNNIVLSTSASSSDDSDHRTIGQVETNNPNSYDYNQVQHHHYMGHEHHQQLEQCRSLTSNRITHLEQITNPSAEQSAVPAALNTPVTAIQPKQRQQETQKVQVNHLITSATNKQKFNNLIANNELDPTRSLMTQQQQVQSQFKGRRGRPRKKGQRSKNKVNGKLWEFIRDLLLNDRTNPSFIRWERREDGVFKFVQSDKVAKMWGERKQNPKMTYEKLSRAMRYYYKSKVLLPVFGRRLVYKFGPNATGWMST